MFRFFAVAFTIAGVAVFLTLYFRHIEGRLLEALAEPATIGIILLPFLPAILLSWKASRTEGKLLDLLQKNKKEEI